MVHALGDSSGRDAMFVEYRAACGRRIDMCGYSSVLTNVLFFLFSAFLMVA